MGQEIQHSRFRKQDFAEFEARLRRETALLEEYFRQRRFAGGPLVAGFEMEAWLVNHLNRPLPENDRLLARVDSGLVTPELARFNVELNGAPQELTGRALSAMQAEFEDTWRRCNEAAREMGAALVLAGILPTVQEHELVLANMSAMTRYRALNEQIRRLRKGAPLALDIRGREHLKTWQEDVMLESAATSFQLHLQVDPQRAARAYNAAVILSAPMVALCANSPYLFGYDLWDETRIPVFEQAVSVCTDEECRDARVTFGTAYVRDSLMECFVENLERYPVLLPEILDDDPARFSHLRLHNGTIWRWNRPLVGFDENGRPHLRIEHRVVPAGPSIVDGFANAAVFFGLMAKLMAASPPPESRLPFATARENFYAAARDGFGATVRWLDGGKTNVRALWQQTLLPLAAQGLRELEIDGADRERYLDIVDARLRTGRNGAAWQRAFVARNGRDMQALTEAYHERQRSGRPVHEWEV